MRHLLFGAAVIVGVGFGGLVPATATPLAVLGLSSQSADATLVEDIGWRRQYRRYGYPVPYAYYPPAYGYYAAPTAYDTYAPPPAVAESYAEIFNVDHAVSHDASRLRTGNRSLGCVREGMQLRSPLV